MALLQRLSFWVLIIALSGCGGSGDGGLSRTETPPVVVDDSTSITLILSTDNTDIDNANSALLTATLQDDGTALSGKVVTFTSTLGILDPLSGTALTDSNGQATLQLHAGSTEGAGEITVTYGDITSSALGFTSAGDGGELTGKSINITSSNLMITAATPATLSAIYTDGNVPVVGEVVTFTNTLGVLDPISGTSLTDSDGIATIFLAAGAEKGAGIITVTTASGESNTLGFSTEGDGIVDGGNKLTITSFTNSTSISNVNPASITVHFETANGIDLSNEVITFTTTLGVLDPVSGTALTNSSGDATIILSAGEVRGAGVLTARSSVDDVIMQGFFSEGDSVGSGVNISLVLTDDSGNEIEQISSISSGKLIATVTGVNKAVIVTFTTDIGTIPIQTAIASTGSGYVASVDLLAGNSLGAGTVIAELVSGESEELVFSIGASSLGMGNAIDVVTGLPNGLIDVPVTAISAGATAGLSVSIWDISNATQATPAILFTTETVEVNFSSGCSGLTVPTANIEVLTNLAVSTFVDPNVSNITNLTGIEDFTALTFLNLFSTNSLIDLDENERCCRSSRHTFHLSEPPVIVNRWPVQS